MKESLTIFDKSRKGSNNFRVEGCGIEQTKLSNLIPEGLLRNKNIGIPEISENEVIRHYTNLSMRNYGVDNGIYPLGSCTMKYNPKINEEIAALAQFSKVHPYQINEDIQGTLMVLYELGNMLKEIVGLEEVTFQPSAGAHGEFCALLIIKKYFESRDEERKIIIIPDSSHGTNFASAAMAGFLVIEVKSNKGGTIDIDELKKIIDENNKSIAAIMITNPNTLGIFEKEILSISRIMHKNGSLLYYDGANLNAIIGQVRPGDMGFDMVHLNLHKTFSTPHGGGGPGAGPVLVNSKLKDFLPIPVIKKNNRKYFLDYKVKKSIGKIKAFAGNFGVCLKAYCYLLAVGKNLMEISNDAVLNANYLKSKLSKYFDIPYSQNCMHEFVLSAKKYKHNGGTALNIAKRLIDYGIHPPTVYFPSLVEEAMMIEPTETENLDRLDSLVEVFEKIIYEIKNTPDLVINAPLESKTGRIDEFKAIKEPKLIQ